MPGYLLDTNVVSELRRVRPHQGVLNWISTVAEDQLHVSAASVGEVQTGIELTRRVDGAKAIEIERWLEDLVATFRILAMDHEMFRECARLLHGKSKQAAYEDAMIAATARLRGFTVATRNVADFRGFKVSLLNPFDYKG